MDHRNPPSSQFLLPDSGATTYTDSVTEADQKTARNNERRNFSGFSSMSGKGPEPAVAGLAGPLGGLVRRGKSMDLDEYFSGPIDPTRHSKYPGFMRMHGSIMPMMIVPMTFVFIWSTVVTVISQKVYSLQVDSVLLTVLGFVVGLSLSFRSSTAYERYIEGRKFWQQLILHSRNIARVIWVHSKERPGEEGKEDLLAKLTAINLVLAFAQAVKHKLRYEIEYDYQDLQPLIDNISTYAKSAGSTDTCPKEHNKAFRKIKTWGSSLGITFLISNPRKAVKKAANAGKHHGNLPFEIMTHIGAYLDHIIGNSLLVGPAWHSQVSGSQLSMMDAYGGCERVLQTPLPLAYSIAISQITWLYVLMLPFQLFPKLGWVAIPGTLVAAYIILGIAAIGLEIENPFGTDVNDLDLDRYCEGLKMDLNILTSMPSPNCDSWIKNENNKPLSPYSTGGYDSWKNRSMEDIRNALAHKVNYQSVLLMNKEMEESSSQRVEGESKTGV
ncbi:uncharacterized protein H6S33_005737 [Morchella sextelata]|uniref:uncharacterized protein n=1 Tax=Morchella sextelata TaxID=1174677 RepID=UPI001D045D85|nr:uncharacterized protein H6S33_005737 [Morchella sextelata]KAH0613851.1 hypothetical protein H6S33_005737 [Morchella sextelata]